MLEGLFEEELVQETIHKQRKTINDKIGPRNTHKLCGLLNQGATCYLNSLIQTLFLTPELRRMYGSIPIF